MSTVRRAPSYGTSIFPSPSGHRREGQIGVSPYMRCIQCGFPNDTRRTAWSNSGDGFSDAVTVVVTPAPGQATGNVNTKQRTVQSGCKFCGSLKWRDSKPPLLPDDRYKPSSEWYGRKRR